MNIKHTVLMTAAVLAVIIGTSVWSAGVVRAEEAPVAEAAGEEVATEKAAKEETAKEEQAEADAAAQAEQEKAQAELRKMQEAHQKAAGEINMMMAELLQTMDAQEKKHFFMSYSNYNLLATVKIVQEDVQNAIKKCGETNPDMKDRLAGRYKQWSEAVGPVMEESQAHLDNMVNAQEYADPKDVRKIFSKINTSREKARKEIEKIPVTTPEACEYLYNKMDETQDHMLSLLRSSMITFPRAFANDPIPTEGSEEEAEDGESSAL